MGRSCYLRIDLMYEYAYLRLAVRTVSIFSQQELIPLNSPLSSKQESSMPSSHCSFCFQSVAISSFSRRQSLKLNLQLLEMTLCSCLSSTLASVRPSYESISLRSVKMSEESQIPAQRSGFAFLGHTPPPVSTLTYLLSV